jgi:hypothetical protein
MAHSPPKSFPFSNCSYRGAYLDAARLKCISPCCVASKSDVVSDRVLSTSAYTHLRPAPVHLAHAGRSPPHFCQYEYMTFIHKERRTHDLASTTARACLTPEHLHQYLSVAAAPYLASAAASNRTSAPLNLMAQLPRGPPDAISHTSILSRWERAHVPVCLRYARSSNRTREVYPLVVAIHEM